MVRKRIFTNEDAANSELEKRRKKGDLESNIYKINRRKFVVGTRKQALDSQ